MKRTLFPLFTIFLSFYCTYLQAETEKLDLKGSWKLAVDSACYNYEIYLPGSTDQAGIGTPHIDGTSLPGGRPETWQLNRRRSFIGPAWYEREITIPQSWDRKQIFISLERCMWQTKLWINGEYVGESHSLVTPHKFDVTKFIKPADNTITLKIDNSPYVNLGSWSHAYSEGIQTIWNGAIGKLTIESKDNVTIDNIQCYPYLSDKRLAVSANLLNQTGKSIRGSVEYELKDKNGKIVSRLKQHIVCRNDTSKLSAVLNPHTELEGWDEYNPTLYTLDIKYRFGKIKGEDNVKFGFRDIKTENGKILLNGHTIFLRGEHDPGSFPLTGYPSMDKEEWLQIFKTGKQYGLNHWRFHSWCPPKAAFEAADEMGIYLQPELPLFSQNWEHTQVGTDSVRDKFMTDELKRLLDNYGNHPSFILMCMGNELKGEPEVLEKWVALGKSYDPRHLYAGNANLEAMRLFLPLKGDDYQVAHAALVDGKRYERRMGSYFNHEMPNTTNDYSHTMGSPYDSIPVITHELGQWSVYPDLSEIGKYTGVLKARNLELFRDSLEIKGLADMASVFLHSSGKLASILYKEDIERAIRTPGLDGFQILDLRDYPAQGSAYVGLLNAFWESKGIIAPEEFRQSCNDITLLLRMPKRIYLNNETYDAEVVIPNYSFKDYNDILVECGIMLNGTTICADTLWVDRLPQGEITKAGRFTFPLSEIDKPSKIEINLHNEKLGLSNHYNVWVYPHNKAEKVGNVKIATQVSPELLDSIENGATVLLVPEKIEDGERIAFATPFWSTLMFDYQPKTMGLYCDPIHPLFKDFPTDAFTDWQWWELMKETSVFRINNTDASYRPIAMMIDHPVRNDKLAAIMESRIGKGKLLVCAFDIVSDLDNRHAAKQLRESILNYMNSSDFNPSEVVGLREIIFRDKDPLAELGETEVFNIGGNKDERIVISLKKERYLTGCEILENLDSISGIKIYVTDDRKELGTPIVSTNGKKGKTDAVLWDNGFTMQKGKKGKYIIVDLIKNTNLKTDLKKLKFIFGD